MSFDLDSLDFLIAMEAFLARAMACTYAGGMGPEKTADGFNLLQFKEHQFRYQDRWTGYMRSCGTEMVWCEGVPVWFQNYGGGMEPAFRFDPQMAELTFSFLRTCMLKAKDAGFYPRGLNNVFRGPLQYRAKWRGDVSKFKGKESIFHDRDLVFTHTFHGGVILHEPTERE